MAYYGGGGYNGSGSVGVASPMDGWSQHQQHQQHARSGGSPPRFNPCASSISNGIFGGGAWAESARGGRGAPVYGSRSDAAMMGQASAGAPSNGGMPPPGYSGGRRGGGSDGFMGRLEAAEARDQLALQEQLQRQPSRSILKAGQPMQQPMQQQMMMGGFVMGPGIMDYTR